MGVIVKYGGKRAGDDLVIQWWRHCSTGLRADTTSRSRPDKRQVVDLPDASGEMWGHFVGETVAGDAPVKFFERYP